MKAVLSRDRSPTLLAPMTESATTVEPVIAKRGLENDVSVGVEGTDGVGIGATPLSFHFSTSS